MLRRRLCRLYVVASAPVSFSYAAMVILLQPISFENAAYNVSSHIIPNRS